MILVVLTLHSVKTLNVTFSRFHNFTFRGAQGVFFSRRPTKFFSLPSQKKFPPQGKFVALKGSKNSPNLTYFTMRKRLVHCSIGRVFVPIAGRSGVHYPLSERMTDGLIGA